MQHETCHTLLPLGYLAWLAKLFLTFSEIFLNETKAKLIIKENNVNNNNQNVIEKTKRKLKSLDALGSFLIKSVFWKLF